MRNLSALSLSMALATGCATTAIPEISSIDRDRRIMDIKPDRKFMQETVNLRGSSGLEVHLKIPNSRSDGTLCSGDKYDATVTSNHPAWIRVYYVIGQGRVMLGWESEKPETIFTMRTLALQFPEIKTEEFVVIAVPAIYGADGFGATAPGARCIGTTDMLKAELLPRVAAIARVSYEFKDENDCPAEDPELNDLKARARRYVDDLLKCF